MPVLRSVLEAIGRTPLVRLERLGAGLPGQVLLKLEYLGPGASIKDRIALKIVEDAEARGLLEPGGTIVELTSGNTGIGLAVICAVKGYQLVAVMSAGNSPERRRMLEALGARVELVPQVEGHRPGEVSGEDLELVDRRTAQLVRELGAFRADQFNNLGNAEAHELTTGAEIWDDTCGRVDAYVGIIGTAGTFVGVARALKRRNPAIRAYAVEPEGVEYLAGRAIARSGHKLQGAGYALRPPLWSPCLCDGFLAVSDEEAIATARELARREGVFAGFSTGANVAAALRLAREAPVGTVVVTTANDSGMKYLTGDLFA